MSGFLTKIAHNNRLSLGPRDLRLLSDVLSTEKRLIDSTLKLSSDRSKSSLALREWGTSEGSDLGDVLTKLALLFDSLSSAENEFAAHDGNYRLFFKSIRTAEENLAKLKASQSNLSSRIDSLDKKVSKMKEENKDLPGSLSRLADMRQEMIGLDNSVITEETKLGDTKRSTTRQAMSLKLGALEELAEKMQIITHIGRLLISEIPTDETPSGGARAYYEGNEATEELMIEAQKCLGEVLFNPVLLNSTDDGNRSRNRPMTYFDRQQSQQQQQRQGGNGGGEEDYSLVQPLPLSHLSESQQHQQQQYSNNEESYQNQIYSNNQQQQQYSNEPDQQQNYYQPPQHYQQQDQYNQSATSLPLPLPPIDSTPLNLLPEISLNSPLMNENTALPLPSIQLNDDHINNNKRNSPLLPARDLSSKITPPRNPIQSQQLQQQSRDQGIDRSSLVYMDHDLPIDEEEELGEEDRLDQVREEPEPQQHQQSEEEEESGIRGHSRRYDDGVSSLANSSNTNQYPTSIPVSSIASSSPTRTGIIEERPYVPKPNDGAYHGPSVDAPSRSIYQQFTSSNAIPTTPILKVEPSTPPVSTVSDHPTPSYQLVDQGQASPTLPPSPQQPTTNFGNSSYRNSYQPPVTSSPIVNEFTSSPNLNNSRNQDPNQILGSKHGDLYVSQSPSSNSFGNNNNNSNGGIGTTGYNTRQTGGGDTNSIHSAIDSTASSSMIGIGTGNRRINAGAFRRVTPTTTTSTANTNNTPPKLQSLNSSTGSQSDKIRDLYRANSAKLDSLVLDARSLADDNTGEEGDDVIVDSPSVVSSAGLGGGEREKERIVERSPRFDVSPLVVLKANRRASTIYNNSESQQSSPHQQQQQQFYQPQSHSQQSSPQLQQSQSQQLQQQQQQQPNHQYQQQQQQQSPSYSQYSQYNNQQ